MQLYTTTHIAPFTEKIDHSQSIFSIGSCFADNIATKLHKAKFNICASPTGILFNPISIAQTLERLFAYKNGCANALPRREELQFDNGRWHHNHFHSSFSDSDAEMALNRMQQAVISGAEALQRADVVIITFGTAIVYRHIASNEIVANCHKQPQRLFSREMLDIEEITERYLKLCLNTLSQKQIIFTVSPIRHLSDGLEINSLSKAVLRVALSRIAQMADNVTYFPSYEIMNDELRDYRFYGEDMTHPTPLAINYIWERFSDVAFSDTTQKLISEIEQITTAAAHRPFNPDTAQHKTFCTKMLQKITVLQAKHNYLDFSDETECFNRYL